MKTKLILLVFGLMMLNLATLFAQTIAVAPIKVYGLMSSSNTVTRLTQLELVKLNKYAVLDKFDMKEMVEPADYDSCFGKTCLVSYGKALGSDYILSGNIDGLVDKIVVSLKIIDVTSEEIVKNESMEFDNQEIELQRMLGLVLEAMHGMQSDPEISKRLAYKNEVIVTNNLGRINNSGPRMGLAYTVGTVNEFLTRDELYGGLGIQPVVSNIGYQFEGQYVGTENFSALVECLVMFSGLEQGKFVPSVSILNGYRFGNAGWEFAFGPSFSLSKTSTGFFDTKNQYSPLESTGHYWSQSDFTAAGHTDENFGTYGYEWGSHLDSRGDLEFSTRWIMAFGRTFRSGGLNIPVNIFYSSQKGGGMAGVSVGFNVVRAKKKVQTN